MCVGLRRPRIAATERRLGGICRLSWPAEHAEILIGTKRIPLPGGFFNNLLDPTRTYYRAYWGVSGAVELPAAERKGSPRDFATPLLSGVAALCQAVQSPDPAAKRNRLTQLKSFADHPSWAREVDAAIKALDNERNRD